MVGDDHEGVERHMTWTILRREEQSREYERGSYGVKNKARQLETELDVISVSYSLSTLAFLPASGRRKLAV